MTEQQEIYLHAACLVSLRHEAGLLDAYDIGDVLSDLSDFLNSYDDTLCIDPLLKNPDFLAGFSMFTLEKC